MNILIIGNGFDLAHNLPTTYSDVLNFLYKINITYSWQKDNLNEFIEKHLSDSNLNVFARDYIIDAFKTRKKQAQMGCMNANPYVQKIYDNLRDNVWFTYFWNIYSNGKMQGINWIDFECEMSYIIEKFDKAEQNIYVPFKKPVENDDKVHIFYQGLHFETNQTVGTTCTFKDFIDKSYSDLRRFIECIEIYLRECVEKINIEIVSKDIIDTNPFAILCFNYTHTLVNNYKFEKEPLIHYLHGQTSSENNNMILGIDEYHISPDKDKYTNYNIYKKFTQRIINETGFSYRDWIFRMDDIAKKLSHYPSSTASNNDYPNNVYIFGHSLDITDKDIINEFIYREGVKTTIFYNTKQQQTQQIANLVKMLTQDKFIDMINAVPPKIIFSQQQSMLPKEK